MSLNGSLSASGVSSGESGRSSTPTKSRSRALNLNVSPIPLTTDSPSNSRNTSGVMSEDQRSEERNLSSSSTKQRMEREHELLEKYREENRRIRQDLAKFYEEGANNDNQESTDLRRRISEMETDHAEKIKMYNEETTKLHGQIAKLRSNVERGEVDRQKLEYDLAVCNKNVNHEKRSIAEKDAVCENLSLQFKERMSKMGAQIKDLETALGETRKAKQESDDLHKQLLKQKDNSLAEMKEKQEALEEEISRVESVMREQEDLFSDLQEKCQALEAQRGTQNDTVRTQLKDLEYAAEREDRLKNELQQYQERVKILEVNVEAERAAHLETKFNSEIIQLRSRDLEGGLEVEKSALTEAKMNVETLLQQNRELEKALDEEKDLSTALRTKLNTLQEGYGSEKKLMQSEVEDKQQVISNLSKQLEVHQKNFENLKEELSQARKRQTQLGDTYGGCMKELEQLVKTFQPEKPSTKDKDKNISSKKAKTQSPAIILETLRSTLSDFQTKYNNSVIEMKRMTQVIDKMSADCDKFRDIVTRKDKKLEEVQKSLQFATKELKKVKAEYVEKDNSVMALKLEIQRLDKIIDHEDNKSREVNDEISRIKKVFTDEEEARQMFIMSVFQRLSTNQQYIGSPDHSLRQYSWSELTSLVSDQVTSRIGELKRANERVSQLEELLKNKEEALEKSQKSHEENINKLSNSLKRHENEYQKQKTDLEEHYTKLITDLHNRTQKTQSLADQAWEKVKNTGQAKEDLEIEVNKFKSDLQQSQRERTALLAACAVLAGALWPAYSRLHALSIQRTILSQYVNTLESFRDQVQGLTDVLTSELSNEDNQLNLQTRKPRKGLYSSRGISHPLLNFRAGVIAVIAAHRLLHFAQSSNKLFLCSDAPLGYDGINVVCCGGMPRTKHTFKGIKQSSLSSHSSESRASPIPKPVVGPAWLTSARLVGHALNSFGDIHEVLNKVTDEHAKNHRKDSPHSRPPSPTAITGLIAGARVGYSKLISRLHSEFESMPTAEDMYSFRDGKMGHRGSLVHALGYGLADVMKQARYSETTIYITSQEALRDLQRHMLGFTQRLHSAEVERRSLRIELTQITQEHEELRNNFENTREEEHRGLKQISCLEDRIKALNDELQNMIPASRFENVCEELNNALRREQQAQGLLNEQTIQMQDLGARIELHANQGDEKDATLSEAVKSLSEAKMELRRKEQSVRQMNKQLSQFETDKRSLQERLNDAEKTMRFAAREKEALVNFLKSVDKVLEQSKHQVKMSQSGLGPYEFILPKLVLPEDKLAMEGIAVGPEVLACQRVASNFMESQQQALLRISGLESERQQMNARVVTLESEISSHKTHIASLKSELTAACHRQLSDEALTPSSDLHALSLKDSKFNDFRDSATYSRNEFVPLSSYRESVSPSKASPSPYHPDRHSIGQWAPSSQSGNKRSSFYKRQTAQPGQPGQDFSRPYERDLR